MIFARNEIQIGVNYPSDIQEGNYEFTPGDEPVKLDFFVQDSPIFLYVTDERPPRYDNPTDQETKVYKGFSSIPFPRGVTGFKMRAETGTAKVTIRAFK